MENCLLPVCRFIANMSSYQKLSHEKEKKVQKYTNVKVSSGELKGN